MKPKISKYMCPVCGKEFDTEKSAQNCINNHEKRCKHKWLCTVNIVPTKHMEITKPKGCYQYFELEKECEICGCKKTTHAWDKEIVDRFIVPKKRRRKHERDL